MSDYYDEPDFGAFSGADDVDAAARQAAFDIVQANALQATIQAQGLQAQAAVKQLEALERQEQESHRKMADEAYDAVSARNPEFPANREEFGSWLVSNPELLRVGSSEETAESLDRVYNLWYAEAVDAEQEKTRVKDRAFSEQLKRAGASKGKLSGWM